MALHVHFSTAPQPCSINETWDCGAVNHSPFSKVGPVPVAAIGIAGYLALGGLALASAPFLLFLCAAAGCAFALYLTFIEKFVLEAWCLYCVTSQGVILLILALGLIWFTMEYISLRRLRSVGALGR